MPSEKPVLDAFGFPVKPKREFNFEDNDYTLHQYRKLPAPTPKSKSPAPDKLSKKKDNLFEYAKENNFKR